MLWLLRKYPFRFLFLGWIIFLFVPTTKRAVLELALDDGHGKVAERNANADFLDEKGEIVTTINFKNRSASYGNNLIWWSHSERKSSHLHPDDTQRAVAVMVRADGCISQKFPVQLKSSYQYPWLNEHGGGGASWFYEFKQTVKLDCRPE
ncbi:MAG: hypothetical protein KBA75_07040 [Alphaproteobacteria bacterium]|nr:hypothetical protein [Alphaproteobacteria bacterium]